jgi:two-component system OmpR family sensor kinase/two-component system sensor histidine kinase BaeS
LEVEDTGAGIAPEDLPHVFERFYRADRGRTRERGGSGLGLTIAQELVRLQGGAMGVESAPGQGARFWFTLPVCHGCRGSKTT